MKTIDRLKYNAELQLTAIFQALLRELELPLEYPHKDDQKNLAISFKRQQVGVRLREVFEQGRELERRIESDKKRARELLVGGAQLAQIGGDIDGMPLSVGRIRPDKAATNFD